MKLPEIAKNFACFWPPISLGGGPPNFWTCIIKNTRIAIMWQSFVAIGRQSSEVARRIKKTSREKNIRPSELTFGRPNKLLGRPYVSTGRPYVLLQMFFFLLYFFRRATSELPRPIAVKLCHMITIWVRFITQVQKFGGPSPQRNWGPKTCKIRRDFRQLQTSIANISGMGQDIQNQKSKRSPAIPPAFNDKSPVNFGPLTTENCM